MKDWPSIPELVRQIASGKQSVEVLVQLCLERIKATEEFHAVLEINSKALDRAREIDADIKSGKTKGKLLGVPFLAKDNFLTLGTHTTAASKILAPFEPPYQATAIEKLEAEGAIMLAKTNLDAFAHGSSTENSDFGPTKNPFDKSRVAGGSSGGSAAGVALGQAAFALGTDTGGSVRLPASFCGIVGLKPTYGLVSRYGVIAMASSTDVIGPLTRSAADAAYVLDVLAGKDPFDGTTIGRDAASYTKLDNNLKGKTVAVIKEHLAEGVDRRIVERIEAIAKRLSRAGVKITEVSVPVDELALAVYYVIVPAEVSSNLARYDGVKFGYYHASAKTVEELNEQTRAEGFGDEAKRRILTGTFVLSSGYYDAYYKQAQTVRTKLINEYKSAFKKADILLGPTAPTLPFKLGEKQDPLSMYLNDVLTVATDLVGNCAISVPVGNIDGLPVGLQLMADQGEERKLLGFAKGVEELVNG